MTGNHSSHFLSDIENESLHWPLRQIRDLTSLPEKHFLLFYETPIRRFISLSRFSDEASIQGHFNGVINALKLRRLVTLPIHSSAESIHARKDIWTYAIFVGALMYGSTRLIARKVVYKRSPSTVHYFRWTPFDGPLQNNIDTLVHDDMAITELASLVLLPLVFEAACLAWLFRDTEAFNTAIELIISPNPDTEPGRIILTSHINKPDSNLSPNVSEVEPSPIVEDVQPPPVQSELIDADSLSQNFVCWLSDAVRAHSCRKYLCMTPDGLSVSDPGLFQHYASCIQYQDWQQLRHDILARVSHKQCNYQVHFNSTSKCAALLFPEMDATNSALKND